jgi:hypothetical protein
VEGKVSLSADFRLISDFLKVVDYIEEMWISSNTTCRWLLEFRLK